MEKPLIGVSALYDSEKASYWMLPGYMKGIEVCGGIPVMLPLTTDENVICRLARELDGFLFTGGQDVSPELYGEEKSAKCGENCCERDTMEQALLNEILALDKPLLGICRGIQFLNAALGGTLYQDLPTEHPSAVGHCMTPPYDRAVHKVHIEPLSPLHDLLGLNELPVNSYHHQAVKKLSPKLKAMAYSEDELVEAVCLPGKKFIWAVQWHPELSYQIDTYSRQIFSKFIAECQQ